MAAQRIYIVYSDNRTAFASLDYVKTAHYAEKLVVKESKYHSRETDKLKVELSAEIDVIVGFYIGRDQHRRDVFIRSIPLDTVIPE